jgi:hypothetical protein
MADSKRERAPMAVVLIVLLVVLPAIYLLSLGPIHWLHQHGYMTDSTYIFLMSYVYKPVLIAMRNNAGLQSLFISWSEWWRD